MEGTSLIEAELLQKNMADDFAFVSVSESLLHKAAKAGNLSMVKELLKRNCKLARELNTDGFRALDIAVIMGNMAIAKELIAVDPELCLLKGRDRKTALHLAASQGRTEVVDELASVCKDCIKDATVHGQTALHLAVRSYQFDSFKALIKWLEVYELQEIINWKDYNGNTVLHLAASTKQYECLELLLKTSNIRQTVNPNSKNGNGLTALDVFDIVMETADDLHTREILEQAGAAKSTSTPSDVQNQQSVVNNHKSSLEWIKYFHFQAQTDSPSEMRNVLLLVAALFTTLAFQAGLQPPATVVSNKFFYFLFLFCMTVSFGASTNMVLYLTGGFPFRMEIMVCMISMALAYGIAVGGVDRKGELPTLWSQIGNLLLSQAMMLPVTLLWLPNYLKNAWKKRRSTSFSRLPTRQ